MTDFDPLAEARAFVARTNGVKWPAVEDLAEAFARAHFRGLREGRRAGIRGDPPTIYTLQPARDPS